MPRPKPQELYTVTREQIARLEAKAPKGFRFFRAAYAHAGDGRRGVEVGFARVAVTDSKARRRRLVGLTLAQLEHLPAALLTPEHLLYVILTDDETRELFGLGSNVEILGVRGLWDGEPVPGKSCCHGFALRVREK